MPPLNLVNWSAWILLGVAACIYVGAAWCKYNFRSTLGKVTDRKIVVSLLIVATFWLFLGLALYANNFNTVERSPSLFFTTPALDRAGLVVAVIELAWMFWFLKRQGMLHWFTMIIAVASVTFCPAHLELINGLLDPSPWQKYQVPVLDRQFSQDSKNKKKWRILVEDWKQLSPQVVLNVDQEQFDRAKRGAEIEVVTSAGALGAECLQGWRFVGDASWNEG